MPDVIFDNFAIVQQGLMLGLMTGVIVGGVGWMLQLCIGLFHIAAGDGR